jgi:hypothetical protein
MFLLGLTIGFIMNITFLYLLHWCDPVGTCRQVALVLGLIQFMFNVVLIHMVDFYLNRLGLFTMGLFMSQTFLLIRLYKDLTHHLFDQYTPSSFRVA